MKFDSNFTTVLMFMAQLKIIIDSGIPEADEYLEQTIQACVQARDTTIKLTNLWTDTILSLQDRDVLKALECLSKISSGETKE